MSIPDGAHRGQKSVTESFTPDKRHFKATSRHFRATIRGRTKIPPLPRPASRGELFTPSCHQEGNCSPPAFNERAQHCYSHRIRPNIVFRPILDVTTTLGLFCRDISRYVVSANAAVFTPPSCPNRFLSRGWDEPLPLFPFPLFTPRFTGVYPSPTQV